MHQRVLPEFTFKSLLQVAKSCKVDEFRPLFKCNSMIMMPMWSYLPLPSFSRRVQLQDTETWIARWRPPKTMVKLSSIFGATLGQGALPSAIVTLKDWRCIKLWVWLRICTWYHMQHATPLQRPQRIGWFVSWGWIRLNKSKKNGVILSWRGSVKKGAELIGARSFSTTSARCHSRLWPKAGELWLQPPARPLLVWHLWKPCHWMS